MSRPSATLRLEAGTVARQRRVWYHAVRWMPVVALATLTYALFPASGAVAVPVLEVGQVSSVDVLAPFDFVVRKSPQDLERERLAMAATVRPIWEVRPALVDSVRAAGARLFTALEGAANPAARMDSAVAHGVRLTPEEAAFVGQAGRLRADRTGVARMIDGPIARGAAADDLARETSPEVVRRSGNSERVIERDALPTLAMVLGQRGAVHPAPNSSVGDQVFVKLLHGVFRPTLVPDVAETEALRAELRATVDTVRDRVRRDERIVAAHEAVTPEIHDRLLALRGELVRTQADSGAPARAVVGGVLANLLVLSVLWLLLVLYRRESYAELREVVAIALIVAIVVAGAAANVRFVTEAPELIPVPFATMLLTVLFSGRMAMLAAAVLALLLAGQAPFGGGVVTLQVLVAGVAGAIGIRVVRRRSQLLATMGLVAVASALGSLAVALQLGWPASTLGTSIAVGAVNAIVSTALVGFSLPVFESLARVTTDLTLLELADPSRPLLRRLATEAPGTYAHSVSMANLCEAACDAVGGNGLLARVGCYYHDIGKIRKPQYFVENQAQGANPHDKLRPEVSAAIIRNHVTDGIALADESGLPPAVAAFIPEHHGTADITYFLDRARQAPGGADAVDASLYRYPGPRPRSVETAVAMLADGVEAAIRVLDDASPARVREAIAHLVRQRIAAGQLADAPLTLAQLDRVQEEFLRVLTGMRHARIDYPASAGGLSARWTGAAAR